MRSTESSFFSTPSLTALLQQLKHLSLFGANALVVEGHRGSGKTTLFNELSSQFLNSNDAAQQPLMSSVCIKPNDQLIDILCLLVEELGLSREDTVGSILSQMRSFSEALIADQQVALLFIDDAHLLEDDALGAVLSLLQSEGDGTYGVKLLFFTEPGLIQRIDAFNLLDLAIYDFQIEPFSPSELDAFLTAQVSDYTVLSAQKKLPSISALWSRSSGYPGQALSLVQLPSSEEKEKNITDDLRQMPLLHLIILAALVAGLMMTFMYGGDDEPVSREVKVLTPESQLSSGGAKSEQLSILHSEAGTQDEGVVENEGQSDRSPNLIVSELGAAVDSGAERGGRDIVVGGEGEESRVLRETSSANSESADASITLEAGFSSKKDDVATETTPREALVVDQPSEEEVLTRPERPTAIAQSKEPPSAFTGSTKSERYIQSLGADQYMLQLLAASKEPALAAYIARQPNKQQLHIYRRARGGQGEWYIVVIGPFADKSSAQRAVASLPAEQKNAGPWPKSVSSIHKEIEEYQRK